MEEFAIGVIGGVAGSILTIAATWLGEWRGRRRRRRSAASALLYELRIVDSSMRDVAKSDRPSDLAPGASQPMLDVLLRDLDLFKPESVEAVLTAIGWNHDVRRWLDLLRQGILKAGPTADAPLRLMAKSAVAAVPAAHAAMVSEGGIKPTGKYPTLGEVEKAPLPTSPFANSTVTENVSTATNTSEQQ